MLNSKDAVLVRETGAGRFQVRVQTGEQEFLRMSHLHLAGCHPALVRSISCAQR